jgi:GTP:adenosylcobinamide-phosphate guanylyltransferase
MMKGLTLLFIAGGKSSRFGGEPKMLSKLGPNDETLFEMSICQMKNSIHILHIHLVVNDENKDKILEEVHNVVKKHELNADITYNIQEIPEYRVKPWGTADAVSSATGYIHTPFLLVNSDDLYDTKTFEMIQAEADLSKNYIIGFTLGSTLQDNKRANRAFITIGVEEQVIELQENLNIEKTNYEEDVLKNQYVSVNLLLLQPDVLSNMNHVLDDFKRTNKDNNSIEALLPNFLNSLITEKKMEMKLLKSPGKWNGVTYKEDIQTVRNLLTNR